MRKATRTNLLAALLYALVLILGMFLGYKFLREQGYTITPPQRPAAPKPLAPIKPNILGIITQNYVDDVDTASLADLPLDSVFNHLDPHSRYLPREEAKALSDKINGKLEGIGVEYYILNDTLLITSVVPGGPAQKAGMQRGDKILAVNGKPLSGHKLPVAEMRGKLKGPAGTSVKIRLLHNAQSEPVTVIATRGSIAVSSIAAAYMLQPGTGYIKITGFDENTADDFLKAANTLRAQGMHKLVLDLRDNGGGLVASATNVADQFLPKDKLIVYTQGAHLPRTDYISSGLGQLTKEKVAVLINEGTASSSEIVAGALQDLKRGVVVGRRSFGKGLIQEQFNFTDGSTLNLTIGRYYTPSGRSIQKSYDKGYEAYQNEVDERFNSGEMLDDTKAAADGGIRPDVYVPVDTLHQTQTVNRLINDKILTDYVFKNLTNKYREEDVVKKPGFTLTQADFTGFARYATARRPTISMASLTAARPAIMANLKALLLKYYQGDAVYTQALNEEDPVIKKALGSL